MNQYEKELLLKHQGALSVLETLLTSAKYDHKRIENSKSEGIEEYVSGRLDASKRYIEEIEGYVERYNRWIKEIEALND